jgi:hypothetical protein
MSDFLTTEQLAARYAVPPRNSQEAFKRLLVRWRDRGDMREGEDWHYGEARTPQGSYPRLYREASVVRLIFDSEHCFCAAVRLVHQQRMRAVVPREDTDTG